MNRFRRRAVKQPAMVAAEPVRSEPADDWPVTVIARWSDAGRNNLGLRVVLFFAATFLWLACVTFAKDGQLDVFAVLGLVRLGAILLALIWVWHRIRHRVSTYELELDADRLKLRTDRGDRSNVVSVERDRPARLEASEIGLDWRWRRISIRNGRTRLATMLAGPADLSIASPGVAAAEWCDRHGLIVDPDGRVSHPVSATALLGTWWSNYASRAYDQRWWQPRLAWREPDLAEARAWDRRQLRKQTGWTLAFIAFVAVFPFLTSGYPFPLYDGVDPDVVIGGAIPIAAAVLLIVPAFRRSLRRA